MVATRKRSRSSSSRFRSSCTLDGAETLVGLFDQIREDRVGRLLLLPRTAIRFTQDFDDIEKHAESVAYIVEVFEVLFDF